MLPMTSIAGTMFDAKTTAANAPWRARALQKPNTASDLNGKAEDESRRHRPHGFKGQTILPPQSGTDARVSFRHAPGLTAAFTAQLLGQIMPDPERLSCGLKSARAYGGPVFALPPGFDARL
jgi:hypothetical protein